MAQNEVYAAQAKTMDVNVGVSTVKAGDPVVVGGFIGVAQTDSDGGLSGSSFGVAGGSRIPHPIAGETTQDRGPMAAVNHCTVMISGVHQVSVIAAGAMAYGAPVYYKTADGTLRDVNTGAVLFGYLYDSRITGAMTLKAFVAVACPIA